MASCRPAESLSRKQTGQERPLGGEPRGHPMSRGASPLGEGLGAWSQLGLQPLPLL